jgi:hypothetical protein
LIRFGRHQMRGEYGVDDDGSAEAKEACA